MYTRARASNKLLEWYGVVFILENQLLTVHATGLYLLSRQLVMVVHATGLSLTSLMGRHNWRTSRPNNYATLPSCSKIEYHNGVYSEGPFQLGFSAGTVFIPMAFILSLERGRVFIYLILYGLVKKVLLQIQNHSSENIPCRLLV